MRQYSRLQVRRKKKRIILTLQISETKIESKKRMIIIFLFLSRRERRDGQLWSPAPW